MHHGERARVRITTTKSERSMHYDESASDLEILSTIAAREAAILRDLDAVRRERATAIRFIAAREAGKDH